MEEFVFDQKVRKKRRWKGCMGVMVDGKVVRVGRKVRQ